MSLAGRPRVHPPARVGDAFGPRVVTRLLPRDRTSNERVEWRCECGERGKGYVFNLRKMSSRCSHARRALCAPDVCSCTHHCDDHRPNGGECLDDDCGCIAFDGEARGAEA